MEGIDYCICITIKLFAVTQTTTIEGKQYWHIIDEILADYKENPAQ